MSRTIHVRSLSAVREMDLSSYDGIITIEDPDAEDTFRLEENPQKQLILRFHDATSAQDEADLGVIDNFVLPNTQHIEAAIRFANRFHDGKLLVHCHAGISRSSAIVLAILLGGDEDIEIEYAVTRLFDIAPRCSPNPLLVQLTIDLLCYDEESIEELKEAMSRHEQFLKLIKRIEENRMEEWYAEIEAWLKENVLVYDDVHTVTLHSFEPDWDEYCGYFYVRFNDEECPLRFSYFLTDITGFAHWSSPSHHSPLCAPASYPAVDFSSKVSDQIESEIRSLFPPFKSYGRQENGEIFVHSTPIERRLPAESDLLAIKEKLAQPNFSLTIKID